MAADGSIVIETTLDDSQAQRELNSLARKINGLQDKIRQMTDERMPLVEQANQLGVQLDAAKAKLYEMQNAAAGTYSTERIADQKETVASLQAQWNAVQKQIEKYDNSIAAANGQIENMEVRAGELSEQISGVGESGATAGSEMAEAMQRAAMRVEALGRRIYGLIKRVFVFSIITKALRGMRSWLSDVIKTNDEATAAIARLKGALLTLAQPLVDVIIPAFITLVNVITAVIRALAGLFSTVFGKTAKESADAAAKLDAERKALKGVGGAAKEAAKSMASFDEINKLDNSDQGGGGGGASEGISADFSGDWLGDVLGGVEAKVVAGLLLAGVALIAIGAALGNLGLVIAGLLLLGVAIAYGTETGVLDDWAKKLGLERAEELVTAALLVAGIAFIVIGAATGNILLLLAGAAMLGAGIVYGNENGVFSDWAEKLGLDTVFDYIVAAMQLAGIALIAIGAAMGNIAMVIAGAAVLALGIAADAIGEEKLKEWWEVLQLTTIKEWVAVVMLLAGIALVAIGAAMGNILMVVGGMALIGLGTFASTGEESLKDWVTTLGLEKAAKWVTAALLIGGAALLIIGILTANIPMVLAGLGLLGAGVSVGITSGSFSDWLDAILADFSTFKTNFVNKTNELSEKIKGAWDGIKGWWAEKVAPVFTKQFWADKFSAIKDGMKDALNGLIGHVENAINWIVGKFNSISFDMPEVLGGAHIGFNIPEVHIPRLAAGAVIPPNSEFLAVLGDQKSGTNIEAPLKTIVAAFRQALGSDAGRRELVLNIDGMEFARLVFDAFNSESGRVGTAMVH